MSQTVIPYRPNLQGIFQERFYRKLPFFQISDRSLDDIDVLVKKEVDWVTNECSVNLYQRKIYRTAWVMLRDLLKSGWKYKYSDGVLELILPSKDIKIGSVDDLKKVKGIQRALMLNARNARLEESSDFIQRMENPTVDSKKPISEIIADGEELYKSLSDLDLIKDDEERLNILKTRIKPYLQLVSENEKDVYTGHKLSEIWRYFRFTWSNTSENTPGRTMLYLIRDAARENHPIMGIASLENSALQITCRDNFIGWTSKAFLDKIERATDNLERKAEFQRLLNYLTKGISDIDFSEFCSQSECENPTDELLMKLQSFAGKSTQDRENALKKDDNIEDERSELGGISKSAESALYRRKRADQLYQLLVAKRRIENVLKKDFDNIWHAFAMSESGQSAIRTAFIAVKKQHIGSSIMELNVCGAIPPYNNILGGKLVALLMLSSQVIKDYRDRYGNKASEIASRLKGEEVVRPANLVYIGTTSLYHVGSSQYNRLMLPKGLFKKNSPEVRWRELGVTMGYGTMHISDITSKCLVDLVKQERGYRQINNIFGEGSSPKMRLITSGVRCLMEPGVQSLSASEFSKHSMARIVYGSWLIDNWQEYFFGEDSDPKYYFNESDDETSTTQIIVDYWISRWLLMRLKHKPALKAIQDFDKGTLLVSNSFKETENKIQFEELKEGKGLEGAEILNVNNHLDYVRNLYRAESSYADYMDINLLKHMHVETKLDSAVLDAVANGKSVVLTGNAGDGKTHIFRTQEDNIKAINPNAVIELDASTLKDEDIYERWKSAYYEGRPFCIAINEAVLFSLAKKYSDFKPITDSMEQVINAIYYDKAPCDDYLKEVVVFDLSQRNTLEPTIIRAIIDKQINESIKASCSSCHAAEYCDFTCNARLLKQPLVLERLQHILNRLNRRGYHLTFRDVEGYISFLLFAGRSCEKLSRESSDMNYSLQNLFFGGKNGEGELFEFIKQTFDPVRINHPIIDEKMINGALPTDTWLSGFIAENSKLEPDNFEKYEARKRAFYFFNKEGQKLIEIADDDESEFSKFMEGSNRDTLRLIIARINKFFGDFDTSDKIYAWQSHRYGLSPRRRLYCSKEYGRNDFEIVHPKLCDSMEAAFELAKDHVILRLKSNHKISLKIDFEVFEVLANAERGVPMMYVESSITRRILQFVEKLDTNEPSDEKIIRIYDAQTRERCNVQIDMATKQYIDIEV